MADNLDIIITLPVPITVTFISSFTKFHTIMGNRKKQRKNTFKKGQTAWNKGFIFEKCSSQSLKNYKRIPKEDFDLVVKPVTEAASSKNPRGHLSTILTVPDPDGNECSVSYLRPEPSQSSLLEDAQIPETDSGNAELDTYRLFHLKKTEDLWNKAFREHGTYHPECSGNLEWDLEAEEKWGLCWQEQLTCKICNYKTGIHKLYNEVNTGKRGRKPAAPNYGVQVGLSHTSISNTSLSNILLASNIPPPSTSSLQKNSNTVGEMLIQSNISDMKNIREKIKELNTLKGLPADSPINVEMDCRYNNPIYSGAGKTPFQSGTQVTQVTVENMTPKKHVIALTNKSKLCSSRHVTTCKSKNVTLPDNHLSHTCTANIPYEASIGDERKWSSESLKSLKEDGLEVKFITTDPDSSSFRAAEDLYLSGETSTEPVHQLDTEHLFRNLSKHVKGKKFSDQMFPGIISSDKKRLHNWFGDDFASRCKAEFKNVHRLTGGDTNKIINKMSYAKDSIIRCYRDDHKQCRRQSFACNGKKMDNWLLKSAYLSATNFKINPTEDDIVKLYDCLDYALSRKVLLKITRNFNTQKVEAVNKAISSTTPKNKTFTRNYSSRVHSAVHGVNRGTPTSTYAQCLSVGAPITKGSRVAQHLLKRQKHQQQLKDNKKTDKYKNQRHNKKKYLYKLHYQKSSDNSLYKKSSVLKEIHKKSDQLSVPSEHSYSRRKLKPVVKLDL